MEIGLTYETQQEIKLWVVRLRRLLQQDFQRQPRGPGTASETDARECAYTLLMRLVGLKCMEARGLLFVDGEATEVVTTRPEYEGLSQLLWQMRAASSGCWENEACLWREGLARAFGAVAADTAVLFEPVDDTHRPWPDHPILIEAIQSINTALPREVYAAPDFLGWVYAFFHAEENRQLKAGASQPRTLHDLAALNRFYTPEWIVRFLVDNTLGRAWLRMHPGSRLREQLHYLAPTDGDDARSPLKRVREIRLLDPACGTMHFGLYACGMFYAMYQEEREKAGTPGWPGVPSVAGAEEIPAAILAHNLHGIDIDPRALQVAAFSLRLAMKDLARRHGLDPRAVLLGPMNLVCGDTLCLDQAGQGAEQGDRLRHLLLQRYDAVVMNPPFGAALPETRAALNDAYPHWCDNLVCAFFACARSLCEPCGWIGMVCDYAVSLRAGYERFRLGELLADDRLALLLHLGWDVLHANVEVGALVASARGGAPRARFLDLTDVREKDTVLLQALHGEHPNRCYAPASAELRACPWSAFAYRLPRVVLETFGRHDVGAHGRAPLPLNRFADCPSGGMDAPSSQYYRQAWEVPAAWVAPDGRYAPFWNGSEESASYYVATDNVVRWDGDGRVIAEEPRANMRIQGRYFQPCVAWGKRSRTLSVAYLDGHALSKEGQALIPNDGADLWWLMAMLNSRLMRFVLNQYCGQHKYGSHVGRLPIVRPPRPTQDMLAAAAREIHDRKAAWDTGNEISSRFTKPWLLQQMERAPGWDGLGDLLDGCLEWEGNESDACRRRQEQIDAAVYRCYDLSDADRCRIDCERGERDAETVWPQMAGRDTAQKRREHVHRLLSYLVKRIVEEEQDGIVPLFPCGGEPALLERVRTRLAFLFGADRRPAIEAEISHELGGRVDLAAWLSRHYFRYHCRLYKRRPIYWHVASTDGGFGALVHYHRFTRDALARLRDSYLCGENGYIASVQSELERRRAAAERSALRRMRRLERNLEAACALDERLRQIQKGQYPTRIPWRSATDQPEGWDPDIDHGVRVNLGPFETAGVLPVKRVV